MVGHVQVDPQKWKELFYRVEKEVGGRYSKQRAHGFSLAES